jgi:hypothetical protein
LKATVCRRKYRYIALVIFVAFGIVMIVPVLRYRFELWLSGLVSRSKGSRAAPVSVSTKKAAGVGAAVGNANDPTTGTTERATPGPPPSRSSANCSPKPEKNP